MIVRWRNPDALPVVVRTWECESEILRSLAGRLPNVPQCLYADGDFAIHGYIKGVSLARLCPAGRPLNRLLVRGLARLFAQQSHVRAEALPPLPALWPTVDGDSRGYLRAQAHAVNDQVRKRNWPVFGELFTELGVPEDALDRFAEEVGAMISRPFALLHADLHRGNVIVSFSSKHAPLTCVDWELATYGDPLHDLAIHLIRMEYPSWQRAGVVAEWTDAMSLENPAAVNGFREDLRRYTDFERAQSVYPDVMRAVQVLKGRFDQEQLDGAKASVHRALRSAMRPLRLERVPDEDGIERILLGWSGAGPGPRRRAGLIHTVKMSAWRQDRRVAEHPSFRRGPVRLALVQEQFASRDRVFRGSTHVNTVVHVPGTGFPVVVRRKLPGVQRPEFSYLSEHAVLRAIEESRVPVAVPRVLALGESRGRRPFTIHTYEGPRDMSPPRHPVHGLLPYEADALVDQLVALNQVDWTGIDPTEGRADFYPWLRDQLVRTVRNLPKETKALARILGLPDADRLGEVLSGYLVTPRRPALLHGSLNPWNLVRRDDELALTIIDWDMALVGDPLYDLARHMYLTPTQPEMRRRMLARWVRGMGDEACTNVYEELELYRRLELVRSAYVDLHRLMAETGRHAPNVSRAIAEYGNTLTRALGTLGLPEPRTAQVNPFLMLALH
ncbi:aminoglycoside phosphotransferase family protein [Streptomyces sp. NPDC047072]|uniref:phosphotransferase family protein n=1 Tax=Streptomyces sp. NPDC047072 TaxID=3154809 RepID=UPI0033C0A1C0